MAVLKINDRFSVIVDAKDLPVISRWRWSVIFCKGTVNIMRSSYSREKGRVINISLHRFLVNCPPDKEVICRDRDRFNCRRRNLVICDRSQRNFRRRPISRTGFKGVWQHASGRFCAELCAYGKKFYGGRFDTAAEAAQAYDDLARKHHGKFAHLNFPKARRRHA